jgi:hypothetical protein
VARPLAAAILTIVGGTFIAIGGIVLATIGTILAITIGLHSALFYVGLVAGLLTIAMGGLMLLVPSANTVLGIATIVLAVISIPFAFGGFVIGFLLALFGGVLATLWKPLVVRRREAVPSGPAPPWT